MNKLVTAVLGLNDGGQLLLEAASQLDYFHIQTVADKDTELSQQLAGRFGCQSYDDYRQLIIQNQLDCLLVAAPSHTCDEYLRMGMKKKFNILKLPPLARSFEEAAGFVQLAQEQGIKFAVANSYRFAESFIDLLRFLSEQANEQVLAVVVNCDFRRQEVDSWQNDPKLTGGGVLLHNCYKIVDQLLCNFGFPQSVYCLATNWALDKKQRLYLTEDEVMVAMSFSENLIGSLKAVRHMAIDDDSVSLTLYNRDKILSVTDRKFAIINKDGTAGSDKEYSDTELGRMKKVLENFALSITEPGEHELCSSAEENLNNMAVLESAYLSARTAMPEKPVGILQMARNRAANIWLKHK